MVRRSLQVLYTVSLDLLALFIVFLPWIVFHSVQRPHIRGFYCNDESLRYPFKNSTVKNAVLTPIGFILAFVVMLMVELSHQFCRNKEVPPYPITNKHFVPYFLVSMYKYYGMFLVGLAVQQTITNIGKFSIGRLRPHFFDVCKPDLTNVNCTTSVGGSPVFLYVENVKCLDESTRQYRESRLSFPSGHSSFSTFVAVYLTLYLHSRLTWTKARAFKTVLQVLMIYGAAYTCLSRVSDNKHHPTDVLAGAIIGVAVAAVLAIHGTDLFGKIPFMRRCLSTTPTSPNNPPSVDNGDVAVNMDDNIKMRVS